MPDSIMQYAKDGGLVAAFLIFIWYMRDSQKGFIDCLLKFQRTMDTIINKCDRKY